MRWPLGEAALPLPPTPPPPQRQTNVRRLCIGDALAEVFLCVLPVIDLPNDNSSSYSALAPHNITRPGCTSAAAQTNTVYACLFVSCPSCRVCHLMVQVAFETGAHMLRGVGLPRVPAAAT
eukprot:COSAG05_NODE_1079_length_5951_cov_17.759911_3_plen_121_part_00